MGYRMNIDEIVIRRICTAGWHLTQLHGRIIYLRGEPWVHRTSVTP